MQFLSTASRPVLTVSLNVNRASQTQREVVKRVTSGFFQISSQSNSDEGRFPDGLCRCVS